MTRRRDVEAADDAGPARARRLLRAGLHARRQDVGAAPREGRARRPRGEPRDDRRLGRLPRRRRASASSTTPSTSSTAARDDPDYALRCLRAAAERRRRDASCCATPTAASLPAPGRRRRSRAVARGAAGASRVGIHCHDDAGCGVANTLAAVEAGATQVQGTMNGFGERTGNANLVTIIANLQLKLGHRGPRRPTGSRGSPRPRTSSTSCSTSRPTRASPTSASNAFAHKGGHARRRRPRRRGDVRARRPRRSSATAATLLVSELAGRGHASSEKAAAPGSSSTTTAPRGVRRARQGARARAATSSRPPTARSSCCCARRPATTSRCSGSSPGASIVEQRADGKVETEATIKIWVDGERYVRTAEGNGPVNALDSGAARARSPRSTRTSPTSSS